MPNHPNTPADPRPALLLCCAIVGAIATLSAVAAVIMTALDANRSPDLPDPLVNNVGDLAASTTVITMILLGIHILRRTSTDNTRAGVAAVTAARTDLKADTGEIPGLAAAMRNPHYIVVRDPGPFDKADRDRTMRVDIDQREPVPAELSRRDREIYWKAYTDSMTDLAGLNDPGEGPDPVR